MSKIIYIPLEHIDSRYTIQLDRDILNYFHLNNIEYIRVYPNINCERKLPPGQFLDSEFTIKFKSLQIAKIAELFENSTITDGDIIFFSDIWFPGIESISYMTHFNKRKVKIRGVLHAGSFTDTDEVRKLERWAKNFEEIIFDISERIFVGSNFILEDVISKRIIQADKLIKTNLPIDYNIKNIENHYKENIIIFNGRNHAEKQPWLFDELKLALEEKYNIRNFKFIKTFELNLTKDEYYILLSKSKYVVSFALQENFGYGILEAVLLGCIPILPNRVVYPEFFIDKCLYNTFNECVDLLGKSILNDSLFEHCLKLNIDENYNKIIYEKWFSNT